VVAVGATVAAVEHHHLPPDQPELFDMSRRAAEPTLRVSELTDAVSTALAVCFPDEVWVQGEISSLRRASSGHVYFELIEPGPPGAPAVAKVAVALFATDKAVVNAILKRVGGVRMTDGLEIRLRGRVAFYGPQGQLQVKMTSIDPAYTLGRLASEREQVLAVLAQDGLLERNAGVPLAPRPWRVGLVTSADSAAEADFVHELDSSGLGFQVLVADARVQGRDAPRSVTAALARLVRARVDVVAVVRGGGARTDLAAFDDLDLARAIATCPVPVLTGIGHEIDTSVADQVAHLAHKTPTACAAHLVGRARQFHLRVDETFARVAREVTVIVDQEQARVHHHATAASRAGARAVADARHRLDERRRRLGRAAPAVAATAGLRLEAVAARTAAVDPARTLARGWSITRTGDGRLVRHRDDVTTGDILITTLVGGTTRSRVIEP
jgi:exodeoxyribonuclease VII large subunit